MNLAVNQLATAVKINIATTVTLKDKHITSKVKQLFIRQSSCKVCVIECIAYQYRYSCQHHNVTGAQYPFPLRVSRSIPFLSVTVCASHETLRLIPSINRGVGTSLPRKLIKSRRFHRTNEQGDSSQLAITLDPDPSRYRLSIMR